MNILIGIRLLGQHGCLIANTINGENPPTNTIRNLDHYKDKKVTWRLFTSRPPSWLLDRYWPSFPTRPSLQLAWSQLATKDDWNQNTNKSNISLTICVHCPMCRGRQLHPRGRGDRLFFYKMTVCPSTMFLAQGPTAAPSCPLYGWDEPKQRRLCFFIDM